MYTVYDTGALIAGERRDEHMWTMHQAWLDEGRTPLVPAAVLAEAWRGGARQARMARLLAGCDIEPLTEQRARAVGVLAGASRHDDVVDVSVVECAIRRAATVVTSNEAHIRQVARAADQPLRIEPV